MHGKTRIPDCWVYPKIGGLILRFGGLFQNA